MNSVTVGLNKLSFSNFKVFFNGPVTVSLSEEARNNILKSHNRFLEKLKTKDIIYGVNTGFGKLSNVLIDEKNQKQLQKNLVRSHASGTGDAFEHGIVRTILYLKLLTYAKGYSGVRVDVAEKIIEFLNNDILPVIPEKGSVGASGDLAPMGHMALALIGENDVYYKNKICKSRDVLNRLNIEPLELHPKEGLSLINGTQVSTAIAIKVLLEGETLIKSSDIIGAVSVENSFSSMQVFQKEIHEAKMHPGQRKSAKNVYNLLQQSEIVNSHFDCGKVQDPYSFRCIPHVHGACRDIFYNASKIINNEINSVSDNPLVMKDGSVVSSGHFHAEHVAQALDSVSIAFCELGAISERRTHYFMKGVEGRFPPFVTTNPGLESGYMIAHVTATALASENKTLAHPASIDSINSSAGQEDLVSMAPWAGLKLLQIQGNIATILAIELLVSGAANFIGCLGMNPGKGTRKVIESLSKKCSFDSGDRPLSNEIKILKNYIKSGNLLTTVEQNITME